MEHMRHLSTGRIRLKMCVLAETHMAEAASWPHTVSLPRGVLWDVPLLQPLTIHTAPARHVNRRFDEKSF